MVGRFSLATAEANQREEVLRLYRELDQAVSAFEGYLGSYIFVDPDNPDEMGRLSLWRDHGAADQAAAAERVMAVRSQLHVSIRAGHVEKIVDIVSTPAARK